MIKKYYPYLNLSGAMIIVGSSVVVGKLISSSLPIYLSTFLSLLIASILFIPSLISGIKNVSLSKNDYLYIGLQGLLGTVLYRIFLIQGLKFVDASYAGILSALQPAMISILAILYLKEKPTLKQILGMVLAVIGLFIVFISKSQSVSYSHSLLLGTGLILLAILGEACFSVFSKKVSLNVTPILVAGIVTVLSCLMMLPLAIIDYISVNPVHISLFGAALIIYYGVFLTFISFILWFRGLQKVNTHIAGVFTALAPISGIILSIMILKEAPSISQIIGGLLIIVSIILVVYKYER